MPKKIIRKDTYATATRSDHCFGVEDNKGRAVGARIWTYEVDFVEVESIDDWGSYGPQWMLGHRFCLDTWATRGGKCFGAVQKTRYFLTAEARDKAVIKYLRGAQARADKQFGSGS